jgi:hypothetical protein
MSRILLRSPGDPFQPADPESVLQRNLIASNSGNLVFLDSAYKILSAPGNQVVPDRMVINPRHADEINERYDAYVIPLANAFRRSYEGQLIRLTQLIRRLRIPVVVLGVGVQANLAQSFGPVSRMEKSIREFARAVLERSPSVGVRGEITADYLAGLGFRDVEVIGCPSMFLWGPHLEVRARREQLAPDAAIALTVSPYVRAMGDIVTHHVARYPNLTYIPQDLETLELLLWGDDGARRSDPKMPTYAGHPLIRDGRVRFYTHSWRWIRDLRQMEFVFGSRIHGTIAAILAGTPAFVFAHDSRTLELARYFGIPHRPMTEVPPDIDAARLYLEAEGGPLIEGHAARFEVFAGFMRRHGLDHIFAHEGAAAAFDARVAAMDMPEPVGTAGMERSPGPAARIRRARYRLVRRVKSSPIRTLGTAALRRLTR